MNCAWNDLLGLLPPWLRREVDPRYKQTLQELRLRLGAPPEILTQTGSRWPDRAVSAGDLQYCVNAASQYSPWSVSSGERGYITAPGGHRIGLCGQGVRLPDGTLRIRELESLAIRVARDFPGIADRAAGISGSVLILGPPGWGKTTLLRDLCRQFSRRETLCVADERCELFPAGLERGKRMDVLSGIPKADAIGQLLRTMGPACLAVDEITGEADCHALLRAANCGVRLLATAHAASKADLLTRPVYRPLAENRVFSTLLVLDRDKSYTVERMTL